MAYRLLAGVAAAWQHASFVALLAGWGVLLSVAMFLLGRRG